MLLSRLAGFLPFALFVGILVGCNPAADYVSSGTADSAGEETSAVADVAPGDNGSAPGDEAGVSPESDSTPIVIDVRSKAEWETGHVASAEHIPHTEIADRISDVTADKDAKIVLYCKSGGRAGTAKKTLEGLGFTNVENAGGYDDVKDRFPEQ